MDPLAILGAYALTETRIVRKFESYGNDNWLVESSGNVRHVLRRSELNGGSSRLDFQLALHHHLDSHGVPTAPIIRTRLDDDRVADDSGVAWILMGFVRGEEYDFARPEQASAAGALLARFHAAGASLPVDAPQPDHKPPIQGCWGRAESDNEELSQLVDERAAEDLQYLRGRWEAATRVWPVSRLAALPAGYIHGDFHGRNLVYAGGRVAALLDFDDVDRGPFAYDIAGGIVKFAREGRQQLPRLRPGVVKRFLDGYETVRPLTMEERSALPVLAAMAYPPNPRHYRWWLEQHQVDLVRLLRDDVANMRALEAEVRHIGPIQ